jgi:hypothetical protein
MIKVGDVFEIPLSDGRRAFGQYIFKDKMGPMIQVFNIITEIEIPIEEIINSKPLFRPVITGLIAAIRIGLWKKIGHMPVKDFEYPNFIQYLRQLRRWNLHINSMNTAQRGYLAENLLQ